MCSLIEPTEHEMSAALDRAEELARSKEWAASLKHVDSRVLREWLIKFSEGRSQQVGAGYRGGRKGKGQRLSAHDVARITLAIFPSWANSAVTASNRMGEARRAREAHHGVKLVKPSRPKLTHAECVSTSTKSPLSVGSEPQITSPLRHAR